MDFTWILPALLAAMTYLFGRKVKEPLWARALILVVFIGFCGATAKLFLAGGGTNILVLAAVAVVIKGGLWLREQRKKQSTPVEHHHHHHHHE